MTIALTRTNEYTMAEICLRAARLAGIRNKHQQLDAATTRQALGALETRLKFMASKGIAVRQRVFEEVSLTSGEDRYDMPAHVADVYGPAMYIPASTTDLERATGETPVTMEPAEDWQLRSAKAATGTPVKYFPYRASSIIQVRIWPTPTEDATIRFLVERWPADATNGSSTADVERPWQICLEHWLAHDLALEDSKDMKRVLYLATLAQGFERDCIGFSAQRGSQQAVLDHDTGYGSYR